MKIYTCDQNLIGQDKEFRLEFIMDRACKEGGCVGIWGRCAWYKDKVNLLAEVPLIPFYI